MDIQGTSASDYLFGDVSSDRIFAAAGDDVAFGGDGDDRLYGQDGDDSLFGQAGNDRLYGGNGNDSLFGYTGNDILVGGAGNDVINGAGFAYDDFTGSQSFGDGEIDILTGGTGSDSFQLWGGSGRAGVNVYYDSGSTSDYALITDFNTSEDFISLASGFTYSLGASPSNLPTGTAIYLDNGGTNELVAILQNVSPEALSLDSSYFTYG